MYNNVRKALDVLYQVLVVSDDILEQMTALFTFVIPLESGVGLKAYTSGGDLIDFRLPKRNFAFIGIEPFGMPFLFRLPKKSISEGAMSLLDAWEFSGSENVFYFKDDDDVWKLGSEFDPVRKYSMGDFVTDFGWIFIVGIIAFILLKLGLVTLVKRIWTFVLTRQMRNNIRVTRQLVEDIQVKVASLVEQQSEVMDSVTVMYKRLLDNEEWLQQISNRVGLRLTPF